jgi:hypothetical protein
MTESTKRIHSFVWGGIAAAILVALGILAYTDSKTIEDIIIFAVLALIAFSFISCLILQNNFIGDVVLEIMSWGFVKLPGLIFELSLDGIIWLLTVKLIFWIFGLILALIFAILAIFIGSILSVFVYPYAIIKSYKVSGARAEGAINHIESEVEDL